MKLGRFPGLAIACLILAALSGFLYWSNHHPKSDEAAIPATTTAPTILNLDPGNVTGVTLKVKGEPDVTLAKQAGTWQITAPQPLPADQEQVSMLLSALAPLTAQEVVTSNVQPNGDQSSNLSQFGLAAPSMELDIEQKGKPVQSLLFGDDTPVGGNTYAMLSGDARIFTASNDSKRELNKTLTDLRNKQLFDFGDNEPDSIDLKGTDPKISLVAVHNAQGWWQNGKKLDADSTEAIVSGLRSLTATKFATSGFTPPVFTVTVTSNNGKLVEKAEIKKNGSQYLARRAGDPSLYVLDSGSVEGILSSAKGVHSAK